MVEQLECSLYCPYTVSTSNIGVLSKKSCFLFAIATVFQQLIFSEHSEGIGVGTTQSPWSNSNPNANAGSIPSPGLNTEHANPTIAPSDTGPGLNDYATADQVSAPGLNEYATADQIPAPGLNYDDTGPATYQSPYQATAPF